MTEYKSIYLDTAPLIYFLECVAPYADKVNNFIISQFEMGASFVTSYITNTEYLVMPYREHDFQKILEFEQFKSILNIKLLPIADEISKQAAQIRAKYPSIKGMDSIQIASCMRAQCDIFLTNDIRLKQVNEINILLVEEL